MKSDKHFLSVIVPIYKQEKTIVGDLTKINHTLSKIRYDYEIIAIIDGKHEDNSYKLIKSITSTKIKAYGYNKNYGKGYAIRYGINKCRGDYIAFLDAGMEINPNGISMLLEHLEWYKADVVVGSKRHPASQVTYPLDRRILSFGAQIIAKFLLGIKVKDTQAGIKIYKAKVLKKISPRLLVKNFAFDLEMLAVANHLGFTKIYEAPIKLNYKFEDLHLSGKTLKTIKDCLVDALAVFYRLKILKYYDDNTSRNWQYNTDLKMRINTGK